MGFRLLAEEAVSMDWKKADVDEVASKAADDNLGYRVFEQNVVQLSLNQGP